MIWLLILGVMFASDTINRPATGALALLALPEWALSLLALAELTILYIVLFGHYPRWNEFFWASQCLMIGILTFVFVEATRGQLLGTLAAGVSFLLCFGLLVNSRSE